MFKKIIEKLRFGSCKTQIIAESTVEEPEKKPEVEEN